MGFLRWGQLCVDRRSRGRRGPPDPLRRVSHPPMPGRLYMGGIAGVASGHGGLPMMNASPLPLRTLREGQNMPPCVDSGALVAEVTSGAVDKRAGGSLRRWRETCLCIGLAGTPHSELSSMACIVQHRAPVGDAAADGRSRREDGQITGLDVSVGARPIARCGGYPAGDGSRPVSLASGCPTVQGVSRSAPTKTKTRAVIPH
jgi:hypothetical protein